MGKVVFHGSLKVALEVEVVLGTDVVGQYKGAAHEGELLLGDDIGQELALQAEEELLCAGKAASHSFLPAQEQ